MIDGYVNPGQEPYQITQEEVNQAANQKELRKIARMRNKQYYKLGMPKIVKKRCKECGRVLTSLHTCQTNKPVLLPERIKCSNPKCGTLILKDASYCYVCKAWNESSEGKHV
ncbi:MAG: hypothetical protein PHH85_09125 [Candidatus Methanoperedens sp.]|nr:hypothetical protein [Candidatus Methanoperedens sp.]